MDHLALYVQRQVKGSVRQVICTLCPRACRIERTENEGKGVCGTAAATGTPQIVPDVHAFPGHIACDSASRSEIVLPVYKNGVLYGVLDIDSPNLNRFTECDLQGLSQMVNLLEKAI